MVLMRRSPACGLCGKSDALCRTQCCGNWICDDYDSYVLFSYARNSCARNHERYTLCGLHHLEQHASPSWKTCEECRELYDKVEMFVWAGTNSYNFARLDAPPSFEPTCCAECGSVIHLGEDGYSILNGAYFCGGCPPPSRRF
jgi:hypothetical protein